MAENSVNPLSYNVPIVNKDGTPTNEFMRKWAQQGSTNGTIPDLSTADAVSAILDLIGATQGSLLARGLSQWQALAPGTTGYVLTIVGGVPAWAAPSSGVLIGAGAPSGLQPAGTLYSQSDAAVVWSSQPTAGPTAHWTQIGGGGSPTTVFPGLDQIMDRWPLNLSGFTVSGGGGGGGFPAGTPPTVVQVAYATSNVAATFAVAPTNGNLLVAFTFNSAGNTAQAGWTKQVENVTGTDWGNICTKTAGASEPTTQQAMGSTTSGGVVIYELAKPGGGTPVFVAGLSQAQQSGNTISPVLIPNVKDCIGISACALVGTTITYTQAINAGNQDVLDNTGNRRMFAGHSSLADIPVAGVFGLLSGSGSTKSATGLFK